MNIAVMSPHTNKNGNTVIASLIAYELSSRNRKVCLTHSTNKSNALYSYFSLNEAMDKTCNSIQILNLIREGGIRKNDISDYCKSVSENLEIFSLNSKEISQEQLNEVTGFICTNFPHDHVIFDVDDNDLNNEINQTIIKHCDCIVYVLTQNKTELIEFCEKRKENLYWMNDIPSIVVVNQFCDIVGSIKQVALTIGIKKPKKWFEMGYNPWIPYATNHGMVSHLYQNMQKRDYQVVDIDSDLKNIVNGILSIRYAKQVIRYQKEENISSKSS